MRSGTAVAARHFFGGKFWTTSKEQLSRFAHCSQLAQSRTEPLSLCMPINHTPLLNSTERVISADSVTTLDGKRRHYRVITARQLDSHPPCARRSCSYYSSTDDVRIDRKGNKMDENFVRNIPRNEGGEFCCKACRVNGGFGGHSVLCHKIDPFYHACILSFYCFWISIN